MMLYAGGKHFTDMGREYWPAAKAIMLRDYFGMSPMRRTPLSAITYRRMSRK